LRIFAPQNRRHPFRVTLQRQAPNLCYCINPLAVGTGLS
jgi:hypothetical protein